MAFGCTRANPDLSPETNVDAQLLSDVTVMQEVDGAVTPPDTTCEESGCDDVENGGNECVDDACVLSCNDGYLDENGACVDLDECLTDNGGCDANALCENVDGRRNCVCKPGFEGNGEVCAVIDQCDDAPCANGGTCADGLESYTCICAPGFEGSNCETNINDCTAELCANGGTCIDGLNGYTCDCPPGFEGARCETNLNDCDDTLCAEGSRCVDGVDGYVCACLDGRYGDECAESQCGDGVAVLAEECDDGDTLSGNGCDEDCLVEWGFYCDLDALPSRCFSVCGDGFKSTEEGCDDGNDENGDGCDTNCEVETPVTFDCAIANHEAQLAAAPDYVYVQSNGEPWQANAVDPSLKVFKFLVVLDQSWVNYYGEQSEHFATQGYPTIERSPGIVFERASYLYELQFGVRLEVSRVVIAPTLTEKCASNNNYVENQVRDSSNTFVVLEQNGIARLPNEAGILRLGVGSATPGQYCHSAAPLNGVCSDRLFTNQREPFADDEGTLNHRTAVTLAHEMGHYFGYCGNSAHPHCLNAHTANEIPDIMVWNGVPASNVREQGMFFKFFSTCTPLYDELVCDTVKNTPPECGTVLSCENGGLDCETAYWTSKGALSNEELVPQEVRDRGDRMVVRCCAGTDDNVTCDSDNLGGLVSWNSQRECSGLMTWPEANRFCRQAGGRLCSIDELIIDNVCAGTGCGYDAQRVWTATPQLELNDLVGTYFRLPIENEWHEVTVTLEDGVLSWRNGANRSWTLSTQERSLITAEDSPYGEQIVEPILATDERGQQQRRVEALKFRNERYVRQ